MAFYHLALGIARVDVAALDVDAGARGVEVLVFEFALHAAVDRVGEVGAESRHVEEVDAAPHFLVGGEADADFAVLHFRVGQQVFGRGHDFGDTRFVVGA